MSLGGEGEFEAHRNKGFPGWVFVVVGSALPGGTGGHPLGWARHAAGYHLQMSLNHPDLLAT